MPSYKYKRQKQKERSARSQKGGFAKFESCRVGAGEMCFEGGFVSFGKMGSHCLKFYSCSDDPLHYWVSVDGEMRNPRTVRGVKAVAADWFERFATSEKDKSDCDHLGFVPDWSI